MNKIARALVLGIAAVATTFTATAGIAEARDRDRGWRDGGDGYRKYYRHDRQHRSDRHYKPRRHHHGRDAAVGGALGLATGLIIGGAIASQPRYVERRVYIEPDYYPEPRVVYRRPAAVPTYEPWTQSWYRYCSQRYRSFNPNTGTFMGYDGREHFCVAG